MIHTLKSLLRLTRWHEWYDSKMALFFFAYYYLIFVHNKVHLQSILLLLPLGIFFISLASFGYMLNDYCDKSIDKVSGKENAMSRLNDRQQILALAIALLVGFVAFIPFYRYKFAAMFAFLSYLCSILYSAYPFRFKEKGIMGLICVSLAQWVLPVLILFGIFEHFDLDTLFFALLSFLIGLRWILVHQLIDRDKDIRANIETFAASRILRVYGAMRFLLALEFVLMIALVSVMISTSFKVLPLIIAYFMFELYLAPFWKKLGLKHLLSSYYFAPLADLYFFWFPLWLSILLGCINPWFFIITTIEILWKQTYIKFDIDLIRLRRQSI